MSHVFQPISPIDLISGSSGNRLRSLGLMAVAAGVSMALLLLLGATLTGASLAAVPQGAPATERLAGSQSANLAAPGQLPLPQPASLVTVTSSPISSADGLTPDQASLPTETLAPASLPVPPVNSPLAQTGVPLELQWFSPDSDPTTSVAWGDVDGDGDLDLAVGNKGRPLRVYANESGTLKADPDAIWVSNEKDTTTSIAWGDLDGDGDLDLMAGSRPGKLKVFLNENGRLSASAEKTLELTTRDSVESFALGDADGDTDIDIAVATATGSQLFLYDTQAGKFAPHDTWTAEQDRNATSVAWADYDGDGRLDLAIGGSSQRLDRGSRRTQRASVGNMQGYVHVYRNKTESQGPSEFESARSFTPTVSVRQVAWGDLVGDNWPDLVVGTAGAGAQIFKNESHDKPETPFDGSVTSKTSPGDITALSVGDLDDDGDLDLAVGSTCPTGSSKCPLVVYSTEGEKNQRRLGADSVWKSSEDVEAFGLAWGDVDGDGDLDLAVGVGGDLGQANRLYRNTSPVLKKDLSWQPSSVMTKTATGLAWGDGDADGYLDLAVGYGQSCETVNGKKQCVVGDQIAIYGNNGGRLSSAPAWQSDDSFSARSVAWGDVNGDGSLELAVGAQPKCTVSKDPGTCQGGGVRLYARPNNESRELARSPTWIIDGSDHVRSVAWADVNGDGNLDLAVGKWNAPNRVYFGNGITFSQTISWTSLAVSNTTSVAWGDVDNDGDLDLAVGNRDAANQLYINHGGTLDRIPSWHSDQPDLTTSLAWGDVDGDGYLDLAVGNEAEGTRLYRNEKGQLTRNFVWSSLESGTTRNLAWEDVDGDGDLDLAVSDQASLRLYQNEQGVLSGNSVWTAEGCCGQSQAVWGDVDNDGDPDLAAAGVLFENQRNDRLSRAGVPIVVPSRPVPGGSADFYSSPVILSSPSIPITYRISQPQGDLANVRAFYSLNGGGNRQVDSGWSQATVTTKTKTTGLAPNSSYKLAWHVTEDGLMGRSDNIVFKMTASPVLSPTKPYQVAGPFMFGSSTASTFPFSVRGTQVQVSSDTTGKPVVGALVFRLPEGESAGAKPLGDAVAAYRTDVNGYLQGRGEIKAGDTLFALLPVTASLTTPADKVTVYHTNYIPTEAGLVGNRVSGLGLQELVVSEKHPLALFDLELSLEWDARNDGTFLADLEQAIKRSSEVLFDVTNGQMALGRVTVYQGRGNWLNSDVVMYGSNSIRPRASMGGVVQQGVNDAVTRTEVIAGANPPTSTLTVTTTRVFTDAFLPGQIRMGPLWDPFGESRAELQQDWWRAFAHEFGHYLLYLPDNYLGYNASGVVPVDCKNSFMTTTYGDDYSEFLTATEWKARKESCDQTIAARTTGRSDWETIKRFYPMVDALTTNTGPAVLPLDLTEVRFVRPRVPAVTLPARNFDLREYGTKQRLVVDQGRAFLFQTQGTKKIPEDDTLIDLGSTGRSDSIKVRGAQNGDRVCVFDTASDPPRVGCNSEITAANPVISLDTAKNWAPNIAIQSLSLPRWVMTVTQPISGVSPDVQAVAISGPQPVISVTHAMNGFKPVTLLRQDDGPMFAIAVTETMTGSQPRLVIKQVSGPAAAISVTQAFTGGQPAVVEVLRPAMAITVTQPGVGDALHVQVFPAYRIPHRPYSAFSPCILGTSHAGEPPCISSGSSWTRIDSNAGADSSATYRVVMPLDYPLFGGFVRVWSKGKEAISQFSISRDRSPDGGVRWGDADGFTMGVDDRLGLGPNDRYGGAVDAFGLGADDRFGSTDDRFGSADDRFSSTDDRFGSTDDRFGSADDRFGSADDRFGSTDDRFGSTDDRFGSADDRFGSADYRGYGANRRSLDAPIASEDAQVIIFNREDVLGDPGALSLQALASVPDLDPWLTSVGRGFRFQASTPISRTLAFNYLRREVPEGYEQNLQIYYSPDEGATWKRLPTYLDMKENLATAPADASGLYVLAAAVDIPLYTPGWNLFAYPVPKTRTVDETLLSVTTAVTTVFGYDSGDVDDPWKVYDRLTPPWVNDLENFEFGHAYWISVTRPITLQLAVAEAESLAGGQVQATTFANLVARRTPPAVFYGEVDLETPAGIAEGDRIVAKIDGVECGEGKVKHSKDGAVLGYVIKVDAADVGGKPECGAPGREISIEVGGRPVAIAVEEEEPAQELVSWNNTRPQAIKLR